MVDDHIGHARTVGALYDRVEIRALMYVSERRLTKVGPPSELR
jgi:hypothetical protein